MHEYEKLGVFYLGRHHDLSAKRTTPELLLYDAKHLVTHGLVVGMTGSGKTGLCFDLIEEAAIDGIPAILIDPKGDLANLLLTFPELRPGDFAPWVNPDDARKKGVSVPEFASQQAELWRLGLAAWAQDGERIRRLRAAAEFDVYTPGSSAGVPVSILSSFAAPPPEVLEDMELLRERVASTVAGLLGLVGIEADAVKSRETILLSNLVQHAWCSGRDLDLGALIHEVQQPALSRIGVLDIEAFYPAKERFELAMQLNNLLASPSFAAWMEGEPLDIGSMLYTPAGKPRVAIFSIAHLGDSERMFFVTLLLNQMLGWMRTQSGTSSLRALLYMDEIFGYFPPVASPPSKPPLLLLLKQGRAFGLGVVLATQNPVDLDYKGLANIGTWFIGRLQTDRDKARVLDGLEGAAAGRGTHFDRRTMEQTLAGLGSRVFLLHSVHEDGFDIFESRWAMSYLRGPLSRSQIKALMDPRREGHAAGTTTSAAATRTATTAAMAISTPAARRATEPTGAGDAPPATASRPVLPPEVPQFFIPARGVAAAGTAIVYQARLLGAASVRFTDTKTKVDVTQEILVATEITDTAVPVDWAAAQHLDIDIGDLEKTPGEGVFAPCAPSASQVKSYPKWAKEFAYWIFNTKVLESLRCPALGAVSRPGESERDFRVRLQQEAHERRDAAAEALRQKYAPKIAMLNERLRRAEAAREREAEQAKRAKFDTVISLGSTLLGAFLGRKTVSSSTVGRAATTMRGVGRAMEQSSDVARAGETVEALQQQLNALDTQFRAECAALARAFDAATAPLDRIEIRPKKTNIQVRLVALAWLPLPTEATP
jgi:hypothetical protein